MVMLTVADTVAPSAVVAVTVIVDGPVDVGVGPDAFVQPTSAPAARIRRASVRYIGARRNCAARCRTAPNIPNIENKTVAMSHSEYEDHGPCQPIRGTCGVDLALTPVDGTALMVMIELAEVVPCAIVAGLGVHVAPVSDAGKAHVMVTSAGSAAPDGVRFRFICNAKGVPATT